MESKTNKIKRESLNTTNLYLAGFTGLVGSELTSIINENSGNLEQINKKLNIFGKINSKVMVLNSIEESANLDLFLKKMGEDESLNKIFVDCTASDLIAKKYNEILNLGVSVVTANKIANSSKYQYYEKLKSSALENKVSYLYETNVGAGLPIIKTLKDLIETGDEIVKIEGIFSGTLSYIFNMFKGNLKFSEVVKVAKEKGFTEPNPESDLTGMDVARKLLILIRECGLKYEMNQLEVENLVPNDARNSKNPEDFFMKLKKYDNYFEKIKKDALENEKELRYIANFEKGHGKIKLIKVGEEHPFYNMSGSDNIVSFYTKRYPIPMVIKGAGAGASVTAAGVYSDILKAIGDKNGKI